MESMIAYWPFWALYFAFALAGWWCWNQLFFFLAKTPALQRLIIILGAVMLFTPAPVPHLNDHLAPAVFVVILRAMSGENLLHEMVITWFSLGVAAGLLVFLISGWLFPYRTKPQKKTDKKAQTNARAAVKKG